MDNCISRVLFNTGILVLALAVLIPMPVAGGIPLLIGAMSILFIIAMRMHLSGRMQAHPRIVTVFACGLLLLGWETFSALFHYTTRDLELIAARGLWVVLGFGYLSILTGNGHEQLFKSLRFVLLLGCTAMLIAMALESAFYPTYDVGRQLGALNIPWPRATGVPQSDGKIGVYMSLACVFFVVAWFNTGRFLMLVGCLLSIAPILFTQSRSTLIALLLTLGFLYLYYVRTSRNVYFRFSAVLLGGVFLILFVANFDTLYTTLRGEGIFARNVDARSEGTDHAINMVELNPVVGPGAEYLLLAGMHKLEVHSTFLGLVIKSGSLGALFFLGFIILSSSLACGRETGPVNSFLLIAALSAGPISEHNLYPGYFNEHLWLIAPIALCVLQMERVRLRRYRLTPKKSSKFGKLPIPGRSPKQARSVLEANS